MKTTLTLLAFVLALLGLAPGIPGASASGPELTAADVGFTGTGGLVLHGTVLAPRGAGPARPGVVLVTGSGAGVPRDHLRTEAVAFARRGLAVLIYDKRSAGYTRFRRSYSDLAGDVLGAVRALRARPGVDPAKVGVWGLSEGGWVAPLAASRDRGVAFVVVVGGNAMTPLRQQVWNEESALRRAGVRGSLLDRGKVGFARFGADAGLFAEAGFDAPGVLAKVRQPLLGIWGTRDLQSPPHENPPLFAAALRRGGNTHYTFRYFAGADHAAHETPDGGTTRGAALAPGYADLVAAWVRDVTSGRLPNGDLPAPPPEDHPARATPPSAWWESARAQAAAVALFLTAFAGYPLAALVRRIRRRTVAPVSRWARLVPVAGTAAVAGGFVYLVSLAAGSSPDPGPLLAGRPLVWLALQGLAVAAVAAALAVAVAWVRAGTGVPRGERVRLGLLLAATAVFVPWGAYWGLLVP
ncbi:Alpha/beta hydrolase family protein [Actinomadura rubteroloni]|uniref:Alpha/beta hydrolase family protein n=1 Tax=Actinomadura rubteroloni TaxID=1926885 RepID=A0A2P4UNA3_9ACTN|nr:prolyl oligopeptidase family serine peptidase [Actinomadura rubteroloni]POM26522.1 Alpha/beta hydrolase family protein [Actinomadura rubteroloni]